MTGKRFLIVDDSRVVRKVARKIIEDLKFTCEEAEDGAKALEFCQKNKLPDGILLDWNMPNMNGLEFVRALRNLAGGQGPIVIFCTTENDIEYITAAIEAGANEYIMKPFDSDILQNKLQQVGLL